ncbi:hypothetical protein EDB80DRAFT_724325 [Ilyonectria destructans]|nr:hypothetical protein EDB80DRAFT_724325 [Ilyonectria destructans]
MPRGNSPTHAETGCLVCRSRKVRCDRTIPSCRKCHRLGVTCPGYELDHGCISRSEMLKSTNDIFKAAGIEKRRVGSCHECRASKCRCTRTKPACQRCVAKCLKCVYHSKAGDQDDSSASPSDHIHQLERDKLIPDLDARLYSDTIPEDPKLRNHLINIYFDRFHNLRCLAFIHKPSFMHSMARASAVQDYGEPLLYVMCALSARCLYLEFLTSSSIPKVSARPVPGELWAEKARRMVLEDIHLPTIQHVMAMILLCEYGLRTDQHSLAFILSGCVFRTMRLLGLDNPPATLDATEPQPHSLKEEIEYRVVWSCYTLDVLMSSGVNKNSSWREDVPQIPLPRSDKDFLLQTSSPQHFLSWVECPSALPIVKDLDLPSLVAILIRLRGKVLRLIRTEPSSEINIWDSASPFMLIIQQLDTFYENLPDKFRITELNTYIHKDQHVLGAVFSLHLMYNAAIFDLTRISLAGFSFPLAASFLHSPPEFRSRCQERCRFHANAVSDLIQKGLIHGRDAFEDSFCADAALESAKVQIIHSATVVGGDDSMDKTRHNIRKILEFLNFLHVDKDGHSTHLRTILQLCVLFGFRDIAEEWHCSPTPHQMSPEVTGSAAVHHLSNMAPFRRAQTELRAHQNSSPRTLSSYEIQDPQQRLLPSREQPPKISFDDATAGRSQEQHTHSVTRARGLAPLQHTVPATTQGMESSWIDEPEMMDMEIVQPSVEDYIRTAGEMSDYLTWNMNDLSELPIWTEFGSQGPA